MILVYMLRKELRLVSLAVPGSQRHIGLCHWFYILLSTSAFLFCLQQIQHVNTLRPGQDGRHFADDSFTCIFFNENWCILIKFSLKYVRKGPIDNNRALVQIMAWRRSGDKPLSESMMGKFGAHICVSRAQWVNTLKPEAWFPMGVYPFKRIPMAPFTNMD